MEKKMSMTSELLCNGLPDEFQSFLQSVMDLGFEEKPSYEFYRKQFRNLFRKKGFNSSSNCEGGKEEPLMDWVFL